MAALIGRYFVAFLATACFFVFWSIYVYWPSAYTNLMTAYLFGAWKYPFLDFEAIPAAIECWNRGIDVFNFNPCDPLGRSGVYSPIWLWLPVMPTGPWWTGFYGVLLNLCFFASLTVLPPITGFGNRLAIVVAILSPHVVFAVERANNDLVMFVGAAVFIVLFERSARLRMASYLLALLLGMMKWYPMTLLVLTLRERLRLCIGVSVAALALFAIYVVTTFDLVVAVMRSLPAPSIYSAHDTFGSPRLADIIQDIVFHAANIGVSSAMLRLTLSMGSLVVATSLAFRLSAFRALDGLDPRSMNCLMVGALLILGCFFAGVSIGYRAVFLLFILPPVSAMASARPTDRGAWFWCGVAMCLLLQLWMLWFEKLVSWKWGWFTPSGGVLAASPVVVAFVACREAVWWGVVTILMSILIRYAGRSAALKDLVAR